MAAEIHYSAVETQIVAVVVVDVVAVVVVAVADIRHSFPSPQNSNFPSPKRRRRIPVGSEMMVTKTIPSHLVTCPCLVWHSEGNEWESRMIGVSEP